MKQKNWMNVYIKGFKEGMNIALDLVENLYFEHLQNENTCKKCGELFDNQENALKCDCN